MNNIEQIDTMLMNLTAWQSTAVYLPIRGDVYISYRGKLEHYDAGDSYMWTIEQLHFKSSDVDDIHTLTYDDEDAECVIYLKEDFQYLR
jgi:predicted heme/steroid binding protein